MQTVNKYDVKAILQASAAIGLYGHLIEDKRKELQPMFDSAAKILRKHVTDDEADKAAILLLQQSIEDLEWLVNKYAE